VAGAISGLHEYAVQQTQYGYRLKGNEFIVDDRILAAFRAFLRDHSEIRIGEVRINRNLDYVRSRIRAELITAAYGVEHAEQFLLEEDEQAMRAIDEIPKARQLRDQAKLFPSSSERQ